MTRFGLLALAAISAAAFAPACGDDEVSFPKDGTGAGDPFPDEFEPAPGGMRRLLTHEYTNSVSYILGPNAAAVSDPPQDIAIAGFGAVGASELPLSTTQVEQYEVSATFIAEAAVAAPDSMAAVAPCIADADATDACFSQVASRLGKLFFRRPLVQDEVDSIAEVGTFAAGWADGAGLDPFEQGLKYELMALLQSPSFLYIPLLGEETEDGSGFWELNAYEIASRMSFFLLGRTPSDALLDAAEAGELDTEEGIRGWADAMLDSSEAWPGLALFYDELYRLRFLPEGTSKNTDVFPTWSPEIASAMRQESLLFLQDVLWKSGGDMRRMYNADFTYVNDTLAEHYGLPLPGSGDTFVKVDWPASQRRSGIFGLGAFLSHQATSTRNSPSKRGKFVVTFALCKLVPPPPGNVTPELPEPGPGGATLQELLEQHMDDPACNTCHGTMDPPGFAFEHFDAIGRHRTKDEDGRTIDGSGSLEWLGEWTDAATLGDTLAEAEDASNCIIRNFIRGRLGHTETKGEAPAIVELDEAFVENGYELRPLLADMTANRLFRYVGDAK